MIEMWREDKLGGSALPPRCSYLGVHDLHFMSLLEGLRLHD